MRYRTLPDAGPPITFSHLMNTPRSTRAMSGTFGQHTRGATALRVLGRSTRSRSRRLDRESGDVVLEEVGRGSVACVGNSCCDSSVGSRWTDSSITVRYEMGMAIHRIYNIDPVSMTCDCKECGKDVVVRKINGGRSYGCDTAYRSRLSGTKYPRFKTGVVPESIGAVPRASSKHEEHTIEELWGRV